MPYLLSNLLLVTESFTLMAGKSSSPAAASSYSRCTPVVVSSVTPMRPAASLVQRSGATASEARSRSRMIVYSWESVSVGSGTAPAFSNSTPCARAGSHLRRRRGSGWVRRNLQRTSRRCDRCRPSTRRASLPSMRTLERLPARRRCHRGRPRPQPPPRPGWRRCCSSPTALGAERHERLDEDGGLHCHVQRARDPGTLQGLRGAELLTKRHGDPASRSRRVAAGDGRLRRGDRSATRYSSSVMRSFFHHEVADSRRVSETDRIDHLHPAARRGRG